MSLLDRLRGRSSDASPPSDPPVPVDPDLERWVTTATQVSAGLGVNGRLVVAVLGESLVEGAASPWFGHEPTGAGLAELLSAVGEQPAAAEGLLRIEADLVGRRSGTVAEGTRTRWRAQVEESVRDAVERGTMPGRDHAHRDAEDAWRRAAAGVQPWRTVTLDPERALGQVRWYPGCPTRTWIGYSDPLGLAMVQRAVQEHRFSQEEWSSLESAQEAFATPVDPLVWRISSLSYVVESYAVGAR